MKAVDIIDEFTSAYVECALWSSADENGEKMEEHDVSEELSSVFEADCKDFQTANVALLNEAYSHPDVDYDASRAGHDFWLTRNRHGTGFWDRGLGDVGDRLTAAAHPHGDCALYKGDDGKIYC